MTIISFHLRLLRLHLLRSLRCTSLKQLLNYCRRFWAFIWCSSSKRASFAEDSHGPATQSPQSPSQDLGISYSYIPSEHFPQANASPPETYDLSIPRLHVTSPDNDRDEDTSLESSEALSENSAKPDLSGPISPYIYPNLAVGGPRLERSYIK